MDARIARFTVGKRKVDDNVDRGLKDYVEDQCPLTQAKNKMQQYSIKRKICLTIRNAQDPYSQISSMGIISGLDMSTG